MGTRTHRRHDDEHTVPENYWGPRELHVESTRRVQPHVAPTRLLHMRSAEAGSARATTALRRLGHARPPARASGGSRHGRRGGERHV